MRITQSFSLGLGLALLHCGGGVVGTTSTCPCTTSNDGITLTLACGESQCVTLNGVTTEYICSESGLSQSKSICSAGDGDGGSSRRDGGADATRPHDAGARGDARKSTDAHVSDAPTSRDTGTPFSFDVFTPPVEASVDTGLPDVALIDPAGLDGGCASLNDATTCDSPQLCYCFSDESCAFACGAGGGVDAGLMVECPQANLCNVGCAGSCTVHCEQAAACAVNAGAGSTVECAQAQDCTGRVGGDASVTCAQALTCSMTVGGGTQVDCTQAQSCTIACQGACDVDCTEATGCAVTCKPGQACSVMCDAITSSGLCPDGKTYVCGNTLCPGASADGGS
jgi:hypothetical protein